MLLTHGSMVGLGREAREKIPARSVRQTHGNSRKSSSKRGPRIFKCIGHRPDLAKYNQPEGSSMDFISTAFGDHQGNFAYKMRNPKFLVRRPEPYSMGDGVRAL